MDPKARAFWIGVVVGMIAAALVNLALDAVPGVS